MGFFHNYRRALFSSLFMSLTALILFASGQASWGEEWTEVLEKAKKEGKVVVSVPASVELRKKLEEVFEGRFAGIDLELVPGRGSASVRRIVDEYKAGVRYFDTHLGGTNSIVTGLLKEGILEPLENWFVLPEVKDPKKWWGGHMWIDKAGRYIYGFQAYLTQNISYNTTLMGPEEVRSYDDFLHPKWKGKLGILDPRTPGSGDSLWSFLWSVKGEEYLKRLAGQELFISRNQRQLGEALANGKVAMNLGITYYTYLPFIKAGLPIKPLPTPKEGTYGSGGSGSVVVLKNAPHPNAAKVFLNWLLAREGQEVFTKAMGQATRRLDVDTTWLRNFGQEAAKDSISVEQFLKYENQSEEKIYSVRRPARKSALKLLK